MQKIEYWVIKQILKKLIMKVSINFIFLFIFVECVILGGERESYLNNVGLILEFMLNGA